MGDASDQPADVNPCFEVESAYDNANWFMKIVLKAKQEDPTEEELTALGVLQRKAAIDIAVARTEVVKCRKEHGMPEFKR